MKKYQYSYNAKLVMISRLFVLSIVVIVSVGLLLSIGLYNQQLTTWIVQNKHNGSTTPVTGPNTNPSIINNTETLSIPYVSIFINNSGIILLIPLIFITCFLFLSRKLNNIVVEKETNKLLATIGITKITSEHGFVNLNTSVKLRVSFGKNRLFKLENGNINTQITGDELYWKLKYLKYKKNK